MELDKQVFLQKFKAVVESYGQTINDSKTKIFETPDSYELFALERRCQRHVAAELEDDGYIPIE